MDLPHVDTASQQGFDLASSLPHAVELVENPDYTDALAVSEGLWLFCVEDDDSFVLSWESDGEIRIARIDSLAAADVLEGVADSKSFADVPDFPAISSLEYTKSGGGTGRYDRIADHWAVYAHGHHVIAASLIDEDGFNSGVLLITFDVTSFGWIKLAATPELVWSPIDAGDYYDNAFDGSSELVPIERTNDLFLIEEEDGVAIGVSHPAGRDTLRLGRKLRPGHTIVRVAMSDDLSSSEITSVAFGVSDDDYSHANTASALRFRNGYQVLAPQTVNTNTGSAVMLFTADRDWGIHEESVLIGTHNPDTEVDGSGDTHVSMATAVYLGSYHWALFYREITLTGTEASPSSGALVLEVRKGYHLATATRSSIDVIVEGGGNRPHLTLVTSDTGASLVLTWDVEGDTYTTYMKVFDVVTSSGSSGGFTWPTRL